MLISPPAPPPRPAAVSRKPWQGLVIIGCLLALLPGSAVRGDIQKSSKADNQGGGRGPRRQEPPPPAAVEGKARVSLDGRVDVVLQSYGGESQEVEFLIRQPPTHGTLAGPPRQLTRNTAVVTYVHRAGDGPQNDGFTFAVQVLGGKVSAAATVVIGVDDIAPDLAATPAELDFGAVNTGDTSRAEITLENRGGGVAAGELVPPAPWEVDGPSVYRLARGERRTFPLVFRPTRGAAFAETVRFSSRAGGRSVRLIGIGLAVPSATAPMAASDPVPPPLATPDTEGNALSTAGPPAASASVAPAVEDVPPASPPPAVTVSPEESSTPGLLLPGLALLGLVAAVSAALSARHWQKRRMSARDAEMPGMAAPARGVPAKERINRRLAGP